MKNIILSLIVLLISTISYSQSVIGLTEQQVKNEMSDYLYSCNAEVNGFGEFLLPNGKTLIYDTTENGEDHFIIYTINKKGICIQQLTLMSKSDYYKLYSAYELEFTKVNHKSFIKDGILYTFHAIEGDDFYSIYQQKH